MGYRKEKKRKKQTSDFSQKLKTGWQSRYPVLLFVGLFALLMGVFYLIWFTQWFATHVQPHILSVDARLSSKLLNLFAQQTQVSAETIYSPSFSIRIAFGCDAIEAMALFACGLLAFPAKWESKIIGLAVGITLLFVLNIFRIVTLFLTGEYFPRAFDVMHVEVWQVIFILLALVFWLLWLRMVTVPVKLSADVQNKTNS